jgi:cellulose synthase/poly-beta-1,6-N-acetylglucosamine synthase-like glycosyltransferase
MSTITVVVLVIHVALLVGILYTYFHLVASVLRLRRFRSRPAEPGQRRFALLIPAHNEASVIGATVTNMLQLDYQCDRFDVIVVADNCDDDTSRLAREAGAICHERNIGPVGRKAFALSWLLDQLSLEKHQYDAIVVFDADSKPSADFLTIMSSNLQAGATVIQGQHIISNPEASVFTRLADIDMRLNNRLRNQSRSNVGLSCRLMGDAMCFHRTILERFPWNAFSLVEDREYGIQLVRQGIHLHYAPEAKSFGQAARGWARAKSQRMRWSGGMMDLRRRYGPSLFNAGFRRRNLSALDQGFELILPPYSLMALTGITVLLLQLLFPSSASSRSIVMTLLIILAWILVPVFGLLFDRAPASLYPYIFLGPVYAAWRNWISLLAILRLDQLQWVRTKRSEE